MSELLWEPSQTEVCLHLLHLPAPDIMLAEVQMMQVACTAPTPPAPPLHLSCTTCTAPAPPLYLLHHPCTSASIMSCTFCTPHLRSQIAKNEIKTKSGTQKFDLEERGHFGVKKTPLPECQVSELHVSITNSFFLKVII